jgi:hypothetical protein
MSVGFRIEFYWNSVGHLMEFYLGFGWISNGIVLDSSRISIILIFDFSDNSVAILIGLYWKSIVFLLDFY